MLDRGLKVYHSSICPWVHEYSPEIDKRTRPYLKSANNSWRVDETYIKVKREWKY
ncbi:MAG: IS6 family transposase [Richelia sp.]|nr:IS6 family transposase [Richelia sp.]CDN10297.1 Transposase and inactivated derivatives-like protein [Richelia intracellularis]